MLGFGAKRHKEQSEDSEGLTKGLSQTREGFLGRLGRLFSAKKRVDDEVLDRLEELLISSDVGVETTLKIVQGVQARAKAEGYANAKELQELLKGVILDLLSTAPKATQGKGTAPTQDSTKAPAKPHVILVVGVNGVGKTTTIGKLAHRFKQQGKRVVIGAADTFRAAAVDQLTIWAKRADVELVQQGMGADPASVAYDTTARAVSLGADVAIIDTAGRLHNKVNLMNELGKIKRAIGKVIDGAPQEILLILDASTGQNAYEQAKQFTSVTEITGLVLTKLDGTARGGVAIGISDQLQVPIRYVGVGEGAADLHDFNSRDFVESLFRDF